MPRIDDRYVDCVVYLYPSEAAAEDGEFIGGSGFIAGVPLANEQRTVIASLLCLVTNKHVIQNGNMVVRVNTKDGKTDIVALDQANWIFHHNGDDLAACAIGLSGLFPYKFMEVSAFNFVDRKANEGLDLGIGDEVFTVGRFISREGKKINIPALRFGNISQMPVEPIIQEDGFPQESFLVEVRSLSGYSGSPVFFYIPAQTDLSKYTEESQKHIFRGSSLLRHKRRNIVIPLGPMLLGVSYNYIFNREPVRNTLTNQPIENQYVRSNTGMMGVIPAWKLSELLHGEAMTKVVKAYEDELAAMIRKGKSNAATTSESGETAPKATDANPQHREDFTSLVNAAARKQPQDD